MAASDEHTKSLLDRLVDNHLLGLSLGVYVVAAIPVYLWLEGDVGTVGSIGHGVVAPGLAMGSLLAVPMIMGYLRSQRLERGFGAVPSEANE
ncbi:MAG: hypothetical protein ABEJ76_03710 [Halanaeroarchaeum sp.]